MNRALEGLIKESEGEVKPAKLWNLATEIFSWPNLALRVD